MNGPAEFPSHILIIIKDVGRTALFGQALLANLYPIHTVQRSALCAQTRVRERSVNIERLKTGCVRAGRPTYEYTSSRACSTNRNPGVRIRSYVERGRRPADQTDALFQHIQDAGRRPLISRDMWVSATRGQQILSHIILDGSQPVHLGSPDSPHTIGQMLWAQ